MGGIQKGFREKAVGRRIRLNSDGRQDVRKTDPFAEKRMRGPPPWRSAAFRQSNDPNSLSQFFPLFRGFKRALSTTHARRQARTCGVLMDHPLRMCA